MLVDVGRLVLEFNDAACPTSTCYMIVLRWFRSGSELVRLNGNSSVFFSSDCFALLAIAAVDSALFV